MHGGWWVPEELGLRVAFDRVKKGRERFLACERRGLGDGLKALGCAGGKLGI